MDAELERIADESRAGWESLMIALRNAYSLGYREATERAAKIVEKQVAIGAEHLAIDIRAASKNP